MPITRINLRPYINNPSLYISGDLLASLKKELRLYHDIARMHPEYKRFIPEIEKDIAYVKKELKKERNKMKTLYLAGAISNNQNYKQDFQKAYKDLTEAGYIVISPLHICREDWDWKACMRQCIKALVLGSDAIAVISSSFYSREMELEIHIAKNLDMPVERVEYWINRKERKHDF